MHGGHDTLQASKYEQFSRATEGMVTKLKERLLDKLQLSGDIPPMTPRQIRHGLSPLEALIESLDSYVGVVVFLLVEWVVCVAASVIALFWHNFLFFFFI